jgi:hypothetical protein
MNNNQHGELYVSGISAAHHPEVERIYVADGTCYTAELTVSGPGWNGTPFSLLMMGC